MVETGGCEVHHGQPGGEAWWWEVEQRSETYISVTVGGWGVLDTALLEKSMAEHFRQGANNILSLIKT